MSDPNIDRFHERLRRIEAAQAKNDGRSPQKIGLLPGKGGARRRLRLPWKTLVLAIVMFLGLKTVMILQMGEGPFDARMAEVLADKGDFAVAWVLPALQTDPASRAIAETLAPLAAQNLGWPN